MHSTWRINFNRGLLAVARNGGLVILEGAVDTDRLRAVIQTSEGPVELISHPDRLLVSSNSLQREAFWNDTPPDWTRIGATDIENWKATTPTTLTPLPHPASHGQSSSWRDMVVPAAIVFILWNACRNAVEAS